MQVALAQAREGRLHILGKMKEALDGSRGELSAFAPRMLTIKINPEKIRDVIGKGGATIRALTEETGTQIDISDDGTIVIASVDEAQAKEAQRRIVELTADVEVGQVYEGAVLRLLDSAPSSRCCRAATACCTSRRSPTTASPTSTMC